MIVALHGLVETDIRGGGSFSALDETKVEADYLIRWCQWLPGRGIPMSAPSVGGRADVRVPGSWRWSTREWQCRGFTLVELAISIALVATLAGIGIPKYQEYILRAKNTRATLDIRMMEKEIVLFEVENERLPDNLGEIDRSSYLDPWGNPYQYKNLTTVKKDATGKPHKCRRDRHFNPLNYDYDLYSMGEDGRSQPQLISKFGRDDIVRANEGQYVGLAKRY